MSAKQPPIVVVDLEYPVEHDGKTYEKLRFRRRKFKDIRCFEFNDDGEAVIAPESIIQMVANRADIPVEVADELDEDDVEKILKVLDIKKKAGKARTGKKGRATGA